MKKNMIISLIQFVRSQHVVRARARLKPDKNGAAVNLAGVAFGLSDMHMPYFVCTEKDFKELPAYFRGNQ